MKYFFFKTVKVDRNRLRPIPGQTSEQESEIINPVLNVQANSTIRDSYPLGTVFGSEILVLNPERPNRAAFYTAGNIYPILPEGSTYQDESHRPSEDMVKAYREFEKNIQSSNPTIFDNTEVVKTKSTFLSRIQHDGKYKKPTIKDDGFYVEDQNWWMIVANIINKENTMLVGPTGTGKTEIIRYACKKLGINCSVFDMGAMSDPVSSLLGTHRIDANGKSVFDYASFCYAVQKPGVIVLDEFTRAEQLNLLFPCLDSRRELPVEVAGINDKFGRNIKIHPECVFFATANIGAEYTGTHRTDAALMDRFELIEMNYLTSENEVELLKKRCSISEEDAKAIVKVANKIRAIHDEDDGQGLEKTISTRNTIKCATKVHLGWNVRAALEMVFLPIFGGTLSEGDRGVVYSVLMQS